MATMTKRLRAHLAKFQTGSRYIFRLVSEETLNSFAGGLKTIIRCELNNLDANYANDVYGEIFRREMETYFAAAQAMKPWEGLPDKPIRPYDRPRPETHTAIWYDEEAPGLIIVRFYGGALLRCRHGALGSECPRCNL